MSILRSFYIFILIFAAAISAAAQGTWTARSSGTSEDLVAVYFTSASRGFIAGDNGFLASTRDGGVTWQKYPLNTKESINEIYFRNDKNGYLVAGKLMFRTDDGGETWKQTRIYRVGDFTKGTPEFTSIRFANKDRGLIIGAIVNQRDEIVDSLLLLTEDGGESWSRVPLPSKAEIFHLDFDGSKRGWIVGDKGLMMATEDGGRTWSIQKTGVERALFAVDFRDDTDGFAVGGGGSIIRTENGGASWEKIASPSPETLKRVYFADDKNGFAVGFHGLMLRTYDKGKNWALENSGVQKDFYGLFMAKKYGCAVGEGGLVLTYSR
ncbi:MAG: BNR repeat-containing glycosyl hydrolase [Acidobacteria bacterium OLB17]|nr:MAG: BNR repeat-containing glycosyl hydrolase [Acidobacteria bacterium OLB17]MCZ2389525.1 hypothetical protein [Acidobacteriota bacterium]